MRTTLGCNSFRSSHTSFRAPCRSASGSTLHEVDPLGHVVKAAGPPHQQRLPKGPAAHDVQGLAATGLHRRASGRAGRVRALDKEVNALGRAYAIFGLISVGAPRHNIRWHVTRDLEENNCPACEPDSRREGL